MHWHYALSRDGVELRYDLAWHCVSKKRKMTQPTPGPYWSEYLPNAAVDTITIAGSLVDGVDQVVAAPASSSKIPSSSAVEARFNTQADRLSWKSAVKSIYDNTGGIPAAVSGDRYIAKVTAHGWAANFIYEYSAGAWLADSPVDGDAVYIDDRTDIYLYHGGWASLKQDSDVCMVYNITDIPLIAFPVNNNYYIASVTNLPYVQWHMYFYSGGTWTDVFNGLPPVGYTVYWLSASNQMIFNGLDWIRVTDITNHNILLNVPPGSLTHATINSRLGQDVSATASPTFVSPTVSTLLLKSGLATNAVSWDGSVLETTATTVRVRILEVEAITAGIKSSVYGDPVTGELTLYSPPAYINVHVANWLKINNATDAASSATGALQVLGGVGIAKKLYVGQNIVVTGSVSSAGVSSSAVISAPGYTKNVATVYQASGSGSGTSFNVTLANANDRLILIHVAITTAGAPTTITLTFNNTGREVPENMYQAIGTTRHIFAVWLHEADLIGLLAGSYPASVSVTGTVLTTMTYIWAQYNNVHQSVSLELPDKYYASVALATRTVTNCTVGEYVLSIGYMPFFAAEIQSSWPTIQYANSGVVESKLTHIVAANTSESVNWSTNGTGNTLVIFTFCLRRAGL